MTVASGSESDLRKQAALERLRVASQRSLKNISHRRNGSFGKMHNKADEDDSGIVASLKDFGKRMEKATAYALDNLEWDTESCVGTPPSGYDKVIDFSRSRTKVTFADKPLEAEVILLQKPTKAEATLVDNPIKKKRSGGGTQSVSMECFELLHIPPTLMNSTNAVDLSIATIDPPTCPSLDVIPGTEDVSKENGTEIAFAQVSNFGSVKISLPVGKDINKDGDSVSKPEEPLWSSLMEVSGTYDIAEANGMEQTCADFSTKDQRNTVGWANLTVPGKNKISTRLNARPDTEVPIRVLENGGADIPPTNEPIVIFNEILDTSERKNNSCPTPALELLIDGEDEVVVEITTPPSPTSVLHPESFMAATVTNDVVESFFECNYDCKPSTLFQLIQEKKWEEAVIRSVECPIEARTWILRKKKVSKKNSSVKWRILPLHAAIIFGGPKKAAMALLSAYPESAQSKDDQGMLPIHLAFRYGSPQGIVNLLLAAYPQSVDIKDNKGRSPLVLARASSSPNRDAYVHAMERGPVYFSFAAAATERAAAAALYKERINLLKIEYEKELFQMSINHTQEKQREITNLTEFFSIEAAEWASEKIQLESKLSILEQLLVKKLGKKEVFG